MWGCDCMKIAVLLLLLLYLFVLGCSQTVSEQRVIGDVTLEEARQAQLFFPLENALTGQVTANWENCVDLDNPSPNAWTAQQQIFTKSSTTYGSGSKEDQCYTWYKGTPQEKTRLLEGVCKTDGVISKFNYWYVDCNQAGKDFSCVDGACVDMHTLPPTKGIITILDTDNDKIPDATDKCLSSGGTVYQEGMGIGCPVGDTPSTSGQYDGVVNNDDLTWIKTNPNQFWTSVLKGDIKNLNAFIKGVVNNWTPS